MNKPFADFVYSVVTAALDLKDRLDRGESPDPEVEQRALLDLLRVGGDVRNQPDFAGDGTVFLGAKYALTCWVDELLIFQTPPPWDAQWQPRILEQELFGTRLRYKRFWDQLDIVLKGPRSGPHVKPGPDALETFLLCAVLGFRGQYRDEPGKVREAVDDMRKQVGKVGSWSPPPQSEYDVHTEELTGVDTLRHVVWVYGGVALAALLAVLVLVKIKLA
ncbi:MAG: DotU family type IV/VI secretion system protein [Planctomycetia bacterium]|nr:DotU family type IV/VI secretion system protein [Planctomycetia bacterium]